MFTIYMHKLFVGPPPLPQPTPHIHRLQLTCRVCAARTENNGLNPHFC